jgi:hypothetical protein
MIETSAKTKMAAPSIEPRGVNFLDILRFLAFCHDYQWIYEHGEREGIMLNGFK